jgi:putative ABC transport system ATP-binding protein
MCKHSCLFDFLPYFAAVVNHRIFQVLRFQQSLFVFSTKTSMSLLQIENVVKRFGAESEERRSFRLSIPSFTLEQGAELVIWGESGSGKTTLLNLIAGIVAPDEGSITLRSTDITKLSEAKRDRFRSANIGFVYQIFNLLQGLTALENVLTATMFAAKDNMTRQQAQERGIMLLERLGLEHKLHRRPRELSVGEQQRVSVARALINKPALILADEPTASVDARNASEVIDTMRDLAETDNTAILTITHDAAVRAMFPQSIAIDDILQR